jgi:hypothetical protein
MASKWPVVGLRPVVGSPDPFKHPLRLPRIPAALASRSRHLSLIESSSDPIGGRNPAGLKLSDRRLQFSCPCLGSGCVGHVPLSSSLRCQAHAFLSPVSCQSNSYRAFAAPGQRQDRTAGGPGRWWTAGAISQARTHPGRIRILSSDPICRDSDYHFPDARFPDTSSRQQRGGFVS